MLSKKIRIVSVVLWGVAIPAFAAPGDDAVVQAYNAYQQADALALDRSAADVRGHVLAPWVEYWRLALRLEDASREEVDRFLAKYHGTYLDQRLRGDWLKVLGDRGDWREFVRQFPGLEHPDLETRCYDWNARLALGERIGLRTAAAMWEEPGELPDGCKRLSDALHERGLISTSEIWKRARLLFEHGRITAAKDVLGYLSRRQAPDEHLLASAARRPARLLARPPRHLYRRPVREVTVLAALRLAGRDPAQAARALERLRHRLPQRDLDFLWARVGYEAARAHLDQALDWYARAPRSKLTDDELAWEARAALRAGDWREVRRSIDAMPSETAHRSTWTYWYGRALAARGNARGARAYYLRISGQTDFYGLLAAEELGFVPTVPDERVTPTEAEVAAAAHRPGLARGLALIRLGMRDEGVHEWIYALHGLDDRQLLAAAELARREEVYDREISAADRTVRLHNFALRYPVPYRSVFTEYAKDNGLDVAWVFGLVRQESRFIPDAVSSAGAEGLMQVMPSTARYVARLIGLHGFEPQRVSEVETNVTLGTSYLQMVLQKLGHPVLASAAYNAGPNRARSWRDARPLEGAIYVETIPFYETRDYVKKVMANWVFYAELLEHKLPSLKARLGTVPASIDDGAAAGDDPLP